MVVTFKELSIPLKFGIVFSYLIAILYLLIAIGGFLEGFYG